MDFNGMNDQQLLELYKKEKMARSLQSQPNQTQPKQTQGLIPDLLNKINPALAVTVAQGARGWQAASPGGQPSNPENDYQKLYNQEAIKNLPQFKEKNYVTTYDENGKPIFTEAPFGHISQEPFNFSPTGQAEHNMKIKEGQDKVDATKLQKENQTQSIIDAATQNLHSIEQAKKGAQYFGVLGNLPTYASPSSLVGEYGPRKEWENNINQLLKQKVVDLITTMKSASKTGATGFGQLSDREGQLLQQASTALTKDLPRDIALKYLNDMETINKKILSGKQQQATNSNQQTDVNNDPLGVL